MKAIARTTRDAWALSLSTPILALLLAASPLAAPAQAKDVSTIWTTIRDNSPRSVFDELRDSAPRSVFDDIRDSAPLAPEVGMGQGNGS